jgi:hypothetical protein
MLSMTLAHRLQAFIRLGQAIRDLPDAERAALAAKAGKENGWFTDASVELALKGIGILLDADRLDRWTKSYPMDSAPARTVGVAMAGNIPAVGFHDFLAVLLSGHRLRYKASSKDTVLLDFIQRTLVDLEPEFAQHLERSDRLNDVDAIIATGSDNTFRYFEYYFRNIPHVLRKNRVSCAVIQGDEPEEEIRQLGQDIFSYYGLGCRNVASVFVPRDYDLVEFLRRLEGFGPVVENHKYQNNYTYQKSLAMLNQEKFMDNGFLLLKPSDKLISPIAVLHYQEYRDLDDLKSRIDSQRDNLQTIVSARGWFASSQPFGAAQFPQVDDYADGVDTMKFLTSLK